MKFIFFVLTLLFCLLFPNWAIAQPEQSPSTYPLMSGLGNLHHSVSTQNSQAQQFFDQGLKLFYAFNLEAAVQSFQQAAKLDPQLAMAQWGIALASSPDINAEVDPNQEAIAYHAAQQALALATISQISVLERDYIAALANRYSVAPNADLRQLALNYSDAMASIMRRYPDDPDAATLYAESLMDLQAWEFWQANGQPLADTSKVTAALEAVLQRHPDHLGANHYYIHALEASSHPELALASAKRLMTVTDPAAEHLMTMPDHIFQRLGRSLS